MPQNRYSLSIKIFTIFLTLISVIHFKKMNKFSEKVRIFLWKLNTNKLYSFNIISIKGR